ncbi:MAG: hypothetical protein IJP17_06910, partial [Clostridia bacterium]|nr:hypothetical protein [Clostridia bacterium]
MDNMVENRITIVSPPSLSLKARQLLSIAAGTIVSFGIAVLLHFVWEWTGEALPAAIFGAVNESVWEHIKILSWGYLAWGVAAYYILRPDIRRYIVARTVGLITIILLTTCFFYIYTGVLGDSVAWVDITSAALWLLVGELVSIRLLNSPLKVENYYIIFAGIL